MSLSLRPQVAAATEFSKNPSEYTLREAVEWYKAIVRLGIAPSARERNTIDARWAVLCQAMGDRESIPSGFLSYMLSELAQMEMRVGEVASAESERAVAEARAAVAVLEAPDGE